MPDENAQPFPSRLTAEEIKGQIATWANRMAMAKQQGNEELIKQALERKQSYENQLARLQEFEVDDK
jgi:phage shock protein A